MRASVMTQMAFGWLALGAGLATAEEVTLPPAIVSAFEACTDPAHSASQRFTLLQDAGWRVAPDDAERSALAALIAAERFSFMEPGTPKYDEFIASTQSRLSNDPAQMRDPQDAGLASGAALDLAMLEAKMAQSKVLSVQLSADTGAAHLSVTFGQFDDGQQSMMCKVFLPAAVDDADRTLLAASLGFDDRHAFVQPPQGGASGVVFAFRNETAPDPLKVRFRSFATEGTLAQMANDLALPVRIGGIIETTARPFPAD